MGKDLDDIGISQHPAEIHFATLQGARDQQEDVLDFYGVDHTKGDIRRRLAELYRSIDSQIDNTLAGGSTCVTVHISDAGMLTAAQLGDSYVFLYVYNRETGLGHIENLVSTHNVFNKKELNRVKKAGAIISDDDDGTYIVKSRNSREGVQVTRSFGDKKYGRNIVISRPEIKSWNLNEHLKPEHEVYAIVASDGIFQPRMHRHVIAKAIKEGKNIAEEIARRSIDVTEDNVSVLVCRLNGQHQNLVLNICDGHGSRIIPQMVSDLLHDSLVNGKGRSASVKRLDDLIEAAGEEGSKDFRNRTRDKQDRRKSHVVG